MSLTDLVRRINRLYHDGSPKWELVPDNPQHLGAIYFMLASNMAPGEMDQFVSLPDYTHSNVTAFFRNYNASTIKSAIAETSKFADQVNSDPDSKVEIKLAGGDSRYSGCSQRRGGVVLLGHIHHYLLNCFYYLPDHLPVHKGSHDSDHPCICRPGTVRPFYDA